MATYRIGLAILPQDAQIGEDVRFEFQFLSCREMPAAEAGTAPGQPGERERHAGADHLDRQRPVHAASRRSGRETGHLHHSPSIQRQRPIRGGGELRRSGSETIKAEFPLSVVGRVRSARTTLLADAIVVLIFGGL